MLTEVSRDLKVRVSDVVRRDFRRVLDPCRHVAGSEIQYVRRGPQRVRVVSAAAISPPPAPVGDRSMCTTGTRSVSTFGCMETLNGIQWRGGGGLGFCPRHHKVTFASDHDRCAISISSRSLSHGRMDPTLDNYAPVVLSRPSRTADNICINSLCTFR